MSQKNDISVLIVGAGPSGLMAAAQLMTRGINFRIIEKNEHASSKSKALGIQARTLEVFQQMGVLDAALANGLDAPEFRFHVQGKYIQSFNLTQGAGLTPFPYFFILPQDQTEKVLIEHIEKHNQEIEWFSELTDLSQNETGVVAQIKKRDGSIEKITADWVIGADGAHSIVRHTMDVTFEGGAYDQPFMLTDADIEWDLNEPGFKAFMEKDFFALILPIKDKLSRIISLVPPELVDSDLKDFSTLKYVLENKLSVDIKLSNPRWTSFYKVHHRCVNHFREGRFFLVGDSAHIHSPAGGQGMNTGFQDAYNLCWKLAMVINGEASPKLLDTYEKERLRIAQLLVNSTDRAFKVMVNQNRFFQFYRLHVLPKVLKFALSRKNVSRNFFRFVSQTSINYQKYYTQYNFLPKNNAIKIKAGDRFPYIEWDSDGTKKEHVFELFQNTQFNLLLLGDTADYHAGDLKRLEQQYKGIIHIQTPERKQAIQDFLNLPAASLILVRPDMHVAMVGRTIQEVYRYLVEEGIRAKS